MQEIFQHPDFWKYVSIPFVAAVVGWSTNWVAIKLTFAPLEFIGIRPFLGWQGIIPSKAGKMAAIFVDSTMSRLGTLPELFEQMEPEKIADQIIRVINPRLQTYTDEIVLQENAILWENLPSLVREQIYERIREEFPRHVNELMDEARINVEDLIDFKEMLVERLVKDKNLLNRLFLECGEEEFRFIINSGFTFGFLFGLVQLAVWIFYPAGWVLPVFGLIVGWATNWIALNVIFRPLHPKKIGPWIFQGLFLKRQKEVAAKWCQIVTREIVTVRNIIQAMLSGSRSENTHALIKKHIKPLVDESVGVARTAAQVMVGLRGFANIKESVGEKAIHVSLEPFNHWGFNKDRAVVVERLLRERMESMPSDQFQDLLRPCFQEDEIKLILVGAVLGLLAGLAQLFFVFGGGA